MGVIEQVILGFALAMDAFAASICKGLSAGDNRAKEAWEAGVWFGGFQALMTLLGYFLGYTFKERIERIDHWIAFILLAFIGLNMIKEAIEISKQGDACPVFKKNMLPIALATSVDALAIGISISVLKVNPMSPVIFIGVITFIMSYIGVKAGSLIGQNKRHVAEFAGGVILILLGVKILIEHIYLA